MLNLRSLVYPLHRWILRRPELTARVPEHDLVLRVHTADVIGRHLYKYRRYEPEVTKAVLSNVRFRPGDVMLDVGANIGWYSLLIARTASVPVDVYAFEPEPRNFALLSRNIADNHARGVTALQLAVGSEPGTLQLHCYGSGNSGRHSLLPLQTGPAIPVEVTTLDRFWEQQGLGQRTARFIKLDIEGYELMALRGAGETVLDRCEWLLSEYSPRYMETGGFRPADLIDLLWAAGFEPRRIAADGLQALSRNELLATTGHTNVLWHRNP